MIYVYKLDKTFGPSGSVAGIIIFIAGIVALFYSWEGIFLILTGAFVGFTSSSSIIDTENKRVKEVSNLLGVIKVGKWIDIHPGMKLGIKRGMRSWRTYSRGNRKLDIAEKDFRVCLFREDNSLVLTLMKLKSLDDAAKEMEDIARELGLKINS